MMTVLGSSVVASAQEKILKIGLEGTYAPFSYRDKNKLTGFEVEYGRKLAKEMGMKPEFVQTKWDSLIAGLDSDKYDIILNNVQKTPERESKYSFGSPYVYSKTVLITNKKNKNLNSLNDINGKKFAQSATSNYGQTVKNAGAKIVPINGFPEAMKLVESNRVDGTINDKGAFSIWQESHPKANVRSISLDEEIKPVAAYPVLAKDDDKLRNKLVKAQKKLREDGTLKKLSEKFFKTDLTNE